MVQSENAPLDEIVIKEILKAIQTLRYGSVEIVVHEGRVTQIEKHEKVRFNVSQSRNS